MRTIVPALPILLGALVATGPRAAGSPDPFPPAPPESVGVSPAALQDLGAVVQGLVDRDEIVSAEVRIIKNRRTVFHQAFGLKDREDKVPLAIDSVFCVRSQTKPLVGAAIQMLIDDGKLTLSSRAAEFIPAFDNDKSRAITIEQLLTHTSGLPLTLIDKPLAAYTGGLRQVADETGAHGPNDPPASHFVYSDQGADTLAAIVAVITGGSAEDFIRQRILDPLGMDDSIAVLQPADPRIARVCSLYGGAPHAWTPLWRQGQAPIFPFFLGSQGLYSTTTDYARFMALWMDGGVWQGRRLLSEQAVRRALTPVSDMGFPTGFPGLSPFYGQMWMIYVDKSAPIGAARDRPLMFAHGGSDGTFAYAWPDRDLMVLCFTQSRGNLTFVQFEEAVDRLLLGGTPAAKPAPRDPAPLLGLYWSEADHRYVALIKQGERPALEIPGTAVAPIKPSDKPDEWAFELDPSSSILFERSGADVAALTLRAAGAEKRFERVKPGSDLPTVDDVVRLVLGAHHTDRAGEAGPFKRAGKIERSVAPKEGTIDSLVDGPTRFSTLVNLGTVQQRIIVADGRGWRATAGQPVQPLEGELLLQTASDNPLVAFGDWRKSFKEVQVVARVKGPEHEFFIVRCTPQQGYAATFHVDASTGLVLRQGRIVLIPGLGPVGVVVAYEDCREVGPAGHAMILPFRLKNEYAHPLLGSGTVQLDAVETGVTIPPGTFDEPK